MGDKARASSIRVRQSAEESPVTETRRKRGCLTGDYPLPGGDAPLRKFHQAAKNPRTGGMSEEGCRGRRRETIPRARGPRQETDEARGATREIHPTGTRRPVSPKRPVKRPAYRIDGGGHQRLNKPCRLSSTGDELKTRDDTGDPEIPDVSMSPDLVWELRRRELRCDSFIHDGGMRTLGGRSALVAKTSLPWRVEAGAEAIDERKPRV